MVTGTHVSIKLHIYEHIDWLVSNYHSKVIKTDKFSINLNSLPTATDKRRSHLKSNSVLYCGAVEVTEGHFLCIAKKNGKNLNKEVMNSCTG